MQHRLVHFTQLDPVLGYKKDTWFTLDTEAGVKHDLDAFGVNDKVCTQSTQHSVFIGKTGQCWLYWTFYMLNFLRR